MIVFVHLLNDRSGSPRVLQQAISTLSHKGDGSCLFVGSDGSGFLDDSPVLITRYWYRRKPYRLFTLATYLTSQFCLLVSLFRSRGIDKNAVIYINTLLPFGAALYGWVTRRPVIYHLHEVSISPVPLRWFLVTMARMTAQSLIYVSDFHRNCLPIPGVPSRIVHNALDKSFLDQAASSEFWHRREGNFKVLMLASLRDYKGVSELVALAARLSSRTDIQFDLVANEDEATTQRYFELISVPSNLTVHTRTNDPASYYANASLVLNLSRPDQWIETFGLTLLEAMAFGVPVVAPPIGGPLELVDDGCEGFLIDSRNCDKLAEAVLKLADDEALCLRMSSAARRRASRFSPPAFAEALRKVMAFQHVEKPNE
jgi:glycosyltransferase involved in cell wall biosynthesis